MSGKLLTESVVFRQWFTCDSLSWLELTCLISVCFQCPIKIEEFFNNIFSFVLEIWLWWYSGIKSWEGLMWHM